MHETRDTSETLITSSLLKGQNKKLTRSKDFVLVTIVLNLMVLILTLIQEIVTFQDLEDFEIITISIIIGQYIGVEVFAMTVVFFLRQTVIHYYLYWFIVSQLMLTGLEVYQTFGNRFLIDDIEFIFRVLLLLLGIFINMWKLWGLLKMKEKFKEFQYNSSIKLGMRDSSNYTIVLENNVLQPTNI